MGAYSNQCDVENCAECETQVFWYCDHCGDHFHASQNRCSCGAAVDEVIGVARFPDGHAWEGTAGSKTDWEHRCIHCPGNPYTVEHLERMARITNSVPVDVSTVVAGDVVLRDGTPFEVVEVRFTYPDTQTWVTLNLGPGRSFAYNQTDTVLLAPVPADTIVAGLTEILEATG